MCVVFYRRPCIINIFTAEVLSKIIQILYVILDSKLNMILNKIQKM
jgi:hypothetical protein